MIVILVLQFRIYSYWVLKLRSRRLASSKGAQRVYVCIYSYLQIHWTTCSTLALESWASPLLLSLLTPPQLQTIPLEVQVLTTQVATVNPGSCRNIGLPGTCFGKKTVAPRILPWWGPFSSVRSGMQPSTQLDRVFWSALSSVFHGKLVACCSSCVDSHWFMVLSTL